MQLIFTWWRLWLLHLQKLQYAPALPVSSLLLHDPAPFADDSPPIEWKFKPIIDHAASYDDRPWEWPRIWSYAGSHSTTRVNRLLYFAVIESKILFVIEFYSVLYEFYLWCLCGRKPSTRSIVVSQSLYHSSLADWIDFSGRHWSFSTEWIYHKRRSGDMTSTSYR